MRATAIFFAWSLVWLPVALAQEVPAPCGLTSMIDSAVPVFPPIAKAAHVSGTVIMLATFKLTGEVESVQIVSGPEMLRQSATNYVKGWRANAYTGPRTCPVAVTYQLHNPGDKQAPPIVRTDPQHVTLNSGAPLIQAISEKPTFRELLRLLG